MTEKKIIAVVGSTGEQGGAVARALLADGEFAVRALTRDTESAAAKKLAELGAEVVAADLYDVDSLRRAFDGAYGAYLVTPFFTHMSAAKELEEVTNLVEAAKGLRHVVWSTLEDTREVISLDDDRMPTLDEKYKVPHFDVKGGEADALFEQAGLPTTYVRMSFYWNNLLRDMAPHRAAGGALTLSLPMGESKISGIASEDIGKAIVSVLKRPSETIGHTIGLGSEHLTGEQVAEAFSEVLGETVRYEPMSHNDFRALGFPAAAELGNMFQYYAEFSDHILPRRDAGLTREIVPTWLTLKEFLSLHREEITAGQ
ncbi:NmrA/HSCARG family protein [Lentzea sp. BCCO 10_0856]|uniref:NmrA/HSCARG family protein n=1 Tax=Lentzea miocenica TaxID=3095431 RepID=A0ABU4SSQ7_9PSEU|nr:NmrA/HSCARG family protein [Lentzea sp. BCCO 10_0856]MDX8028926.1 NmrA/HSCARG family protein [Lentzea sp. BCCO 10_0856]